MNCPKCNKSACDSCGSFKCGWDYWVNENWISVKNPLPDEYENDLVFTRFKTKEVRMKHRILQEATHEKLDDLAQKVAEALNTEKDVKVIMTILMTCLQHSIDCCQDPDNAREMVMHIMSKPIQYHLENQE